MPSNSSQVAMTLRSKSKKPQNDKYYDGMLMKNAVGTKAEEAFILIRKVEGIEENNRENMIFS